MRAESRLTICVVAAVLAGCGGSNKEAQPAPTAAATQEARVVQPGAPGEPSRVVTATPTPAGGPFIQADVDFMQGMIHHHNQALVMTAWVPERTQDTGLRLLARRMEVSQGDEIEQIKRWLEARKIQPEEHSGDHTTTMPGMLSQAELDELKAAKGVEFDKLFLKYMTKHHEGAIQMVRDLQEAGGAVESEISTFALHVESDQMIEIERMDQLLAKLDG